jgi:hypothetical protein
MSTAVALNDLLWKMGNQNRLATKIEVTVSVLVQAQIPSPQ